MLEGDATKDDYGLSSEDKNVLMNVNIIFHMAATVRFEEKLSTAININVKSTKFLLKFAQKLPNFKVYSIFLLFEILILLYINKYFKCIESIISILCS